MCSPVEGPRRTETSHFFYKIVGIKVSCTYFLTICVIIFQHTGRIFIRYYAFYIYIYIYIYIYTYMYFTVQYHPGLPDIKGTLKFFLPILYTSERMSMVFSRPPVVSFSQPKNLSQQLCRAKLQVPQKEAIQSKPCQGNRCQLCTAFVSAN